MELVLDEICNVGNLESSGAEEDGHDDLFRYPTGPGNFVIRHS